MDGGGKGPGGALCVLGGMESCEGTGRGKGKKLADGLAPHPPVSLHRLFLLLIANCSNPLQWPPESSQCFWVIVLSKRDPLRGGRWLFKLISESLQLPSLALIIGSVSCLLTVYLVFFAQSRAPPALLSVICNAGETRSARRS